MGTGLQGRGMTDCSLPSTEARLLVRSGVIHGSDSSNSSKTACELLPGRTEAAVVLGCTQSTADRAVVESQVGPNEG